MNVFRRSLWTVLIGAGLVASGSLLPALAADQPAAAPDESIYGITLSAEQREHWAFQSVKPVDLPAVTAPEGWSQSPIDLFVWEQQAAKKVRPSPPAEPRVWLRRVYFDLIGLPPTPEDIDAFVADSSPAARGRVVDRLLADPGYGVRWGRRWLDLVRYADTNGYERDGDKPSAWRYRDYVIDSLNADKPFDQFLTEQLAGDEVENVSAESMTATTFLRLGTWDDEPADPVVDRYDQLDDVVRGVATTFLGLTLNCARCHNHKFEPLSQIDYTRMLAVFAPLQRPQEGRIEFDLAVGTPASRALFNETQRRAEEAIKLITSQLKDLETAVATRFLKSTDANFPAEVWQAFLTTADQRTDPQKALVRQHGKEFEKAVDAFYSKDEKRQREGFETAVKTLKASLPIELPKAYIFQEVQGAPPPVQVLRRGDPTTPAGLVEPGIPVVLASSSKLNVVPPTGSSTTGRRLALARWMTDRSNPLVARVIVNRIWQAHFGEGLVQTESDFGVMGYPPTHPALLDWLANSLVQGGWKLKDLHRQIVLSQTYAQSSTWREDAGKIDQENKFLWRFPYRRLDAEPIRDAILASNGTLNSKHGGPGIYPKIAAEVLAGQSRPGNGWGKSPPDEAARRSAYIFVKRSLLVPFFELMDLPDTTTSCEQRNVSTIPTQALTLLNGEFMHDQARLLAQRVARERADVTRQVTRAYELTIGRTPTADELAQSVKFVELRRASADQAQSDGALAAFCLVLYNLNEFYYID